MTKRLTLQQMFDNAVRGIYAQGERACDDGISCCMYRLELPTKVLKCAIGQSIPDSLYVAEMEGMGPLGLREAFPTIKALFPDDVGTVGALGELQACHDEQDPSSFMEGFLSDAWVFAREHKLTWPGDVPRPD
jgi:hypothetical protein